MVRFRRGRDYQAPRIQKCCPNAWNLRRRISQDALLRSDFVGRIDQWALLDVLLVGLAIGSGRVTPFSAAFIVSKGILLSFVVDLP